MADSQDRVCWTVLFAGAVQGVGFRYRTEHVAQAYDVTGYVRNLPDGRVELLAEGLRSEVERFLDAVEESMAGYIRSRQRHEGPATGYYHEFSIQH
ncbi:MAG: acylphosphatase [Planctomycetes bacterium]|nr:acylphosphatase [Planctomycetota bacterium]